MQAAFVVCRVFFKALHKNSVSENGLSSCAEESFSAVRHIGVQHNGCVSPHIAEAQICGDHSIDRKISVSPLKPVSDLQENQIATASASVATLQCCEGPQDSETVIYFHLCFSVISMLFLTCDFGKLFSLLLMYLYYIQCLEHKTDLLL